jgi:hypothetical protein
LGDPLYEEFATPGLKSMLVARHQLSAHVVFVNFRGSIRKPSRKPTGSFPPPASLRFARDLGVFGSFPLRRILSSGSPSHVLRRHLSVLRPSSLPLPASRADHEPPKKAPRLSFGTFQRFRVARPIFSPLVWRGVEEALPRFLNAPSSGFGYPLDGFKASQPLGAFFSPQRS